MTGQFETAKTIDSLRTALAALQAKYDEAIIRQEAFKAAANVELDEIAALRKDKERTEDGCPNCRHFTYKVWSFCLICGQDLGVISAEIKSQSGDAAMQSGEESK